MPSSTINAAWEALPLRARNRFTGVGFMSSSVLPLTDAPELLVEFSQRIIRHTFLLLSRNSGLHYQTFSLLAVDIFLITEKLFF